MSANARDVELSVDITNHMKNPTTVLLGREDDKGQAAYQLFGMEYTSVVEVLRQMLDEADARAVDRWHELPEVLARELEWLDGKQQRLDELGRRRFAFGWHPGRRSTSSFTLSIADPQLLDDHLISVGYSKAEERSQLTVRLTDVGQPAVWGSVQEITLGGRTGNLRVALEGDAREPLRKGTLSFSDRGEGAVVAADSAPFNVLTTWLGSATESSYPEVCAWRFLESLVGADALPARSSEESGLWHSDDMVDRAPGDPITWIQARERSIADLHATLSTRAHSLCKLITGAAGTGKTQLVAELATHFLRSHDTKQSLEPARVLVVAATHYALDNFVRCFRRITSGEYVVYRFIPAAQRDDYATGEWDREVLSWSSNHYRQLVDGFTKSFAVGSTAGDMEKISERIQKRLDVIQRLQPTRSQHCIVTPHEAWRQSILLAAPVLSDNECAIFSEAFERQLSILRRNSRAVTRDEKSMLRKPDLDPYATFAARIIVTTVDSVVSLPDVRFDVVICEEASQLRVAKLLKVLTKAARPRGDGTLPVVILSGDPRQLPPFNDPRDEYGSQSVQSQTPFEVMISRNPSLVTTLTEQHRMHSSIADVVRRLFYRDQTWHLADSGEDDRVVWVDTSRFGEEQWERDGASRFNSVEVDVVRNLVEVIQSESTDILIVSPYLAQVRKLRDVIPEFSVQTVDGCQGKQAHSVVVSFVSLDLESDRSFVAEPRRMNVALSRASQRLYLVGNLHDLCESVRVVGRQLPHMAGLAYLFGAGGPLAHCVRNGKA